MTAPRRALGSSQLRREDPRLLTGRGRFVGDIVLPRMLEAVFVRSGHAHARLGAITTDFALEMPEVEAVLTAKDLPPVEMLNARHPDLLATPQPILAVDRVRFVGEPVALVLARDRYTAEDAADQVDVDYDVLDLGSEPLFEHVSDDVVFRDVQTFGDVDRAFADAATVVSSTLRYARQLACPLEARGCVADFDPGAGTVSVWSSTQAPHRLRRDVAAAVGLAEHQIRVHMHDIGGGFGQKIPTHVEEVAVVLASMASGRPVRWIEDRQENLVAAPHSRDQRLRLELALDEDMRFLGLRAALSGDAGAYSFNSATCLTEAYRSARSMPGGYRLENYSYDVAISLSNKSPIGAYRGVGFAAAQCARELLIDKAARRVSVDRFELRRRNMVSHADMPYTTCTGWVLDDLSLTESLIAAQERLAETSLDASGNVRDAGPGLLRGFGISPYVEPSGTGAAGGRQVHGFPSPSHDCARVAIDSSGKATVTVGTPSMGQGLETTLSQVAADALGIPAEDVRVAWSDTSQAPVSLTGSRASRAAVVSGGAVGKAAATVRDELIAVAAETLEANAADLRVEDGRVWVTGEGQPRLLVSDVVSGAYFRDDLRTPGSERTFDVTAFYDPPASYSNGCVVAVVDVDPDTGAITIDRVIGVEDCGTRINPMIVEGQFVGAVAQAIGAVLLERFEYNEDGQPVTSTLMDYLQPTATDTVRVDLTALSTPSSVTWQGLKGMGESGVIGTVAALASAIDDALSQRRASVEELPMRPCTVWTALQNPPNVQDSPQHPDGESP